MPIQPHQQTIIIYVIIIILLFFLIRYVSNPKRVEQIPIGIRHSDDDMRLETLINDTNKGYNHTQRYFKHVVTENDISNGYIKINTHSYGLDLRKLVAITSVCCDSVNDKPLVREIPNSKLTLHQNLIIISPISNSDFNWPSTYTEKRLPEIYIYTFGNESLKSAW